MEQVKDRGIHIHVYNSYGGVSGYKVKVNHLLDNAVDENGNRYYKPKHVKPDKNLIYHFGITKLRNGAYVIIREINVKGKPRKEGEREAWITTPEEALDHIIMSNNMYLLHKEKYQELKWLYYAKPSDYTDSCEYPDENPPYTRRRKRRITDEAHA